MKLLITLAVAALFLSSGASYADTTRIKNAKTALEEGRTEDAEEICRQVSKEDRDWDASRRVLGETLLRTRRYREAEECFRPLVEKSRRDVPSRLGLARALAARKDVKGSEALFKQVLDIDRKNVEALRELGRLLSPIGRGGEARTHLEKAWRLDPRSIDTARLLVEVHVVGYKDYATGRKVAEAITKAHKKKAAGWHLLADVRQAEGKSEEAIEALRRGVRAEPGESEIHGRLADLLLEHLQANRREDRRAEAIKHLERYFELGGKNSERRSRLESLQTSEE